MDLDALHTHRNDMLAKNQNLIWILASGITYCVCAIFAYQMENTGIIDTLFGEYSRFFARSDLFSQRLIEESLRRYSEIGDGDIGGFMVAFEENVHIAAVRAVDGPGIARDAYPYISHFNGQYVLGRSLIDVLGISSAAAMASLQAVALIGMAVVVSLIASAVRRDFGAPHAVIVLAVFCLSGLLLLRSTSAYWLIFLCFMPLAVSMSFYSTWSFKHGFLLFLILIAFLMFIKSLTGYEYLSCIAMSAATPILYCEIRRSSFSQRDFLRMFRRILWIGLASIAGFLLAVALHLVKLKHFFGSIEQGFQGLFVILSYSSLGEASGIRGNVPPLGDVILAWIKTFLAYNLHINMILIIASIYLAYIATRSRARASGHTAPDRAILSALCAASFALLSTISWSVLAIKHGSVHPHINWIQNYLCFYIFFAIFLVECAAKYVFPRTAGPEPERRRS